MQAQQHEGGLAKKAEEAAFQLHRTTCLQEEHLMWRAAAAAKWAALWGAALASGQEDGALCAFSLACALAALLLAIQEQLGPGCAANGRRRAVGTRPPARVVDASPATRARR